MKIQNSIRSKIEKAFAPLLHLELENESHQHSSGATAETHFRLVIAGEIFEGMDRVSRQRKIMDLLAEERALGLHALTMRVFTPSEWAAVKDNFEMVSPSCHGGSKQLKG